MSCIRTALLLGPRRNGTCNVDCFCWKGWKFETAILKHLYFSLMLQTRKYLMCVQRIFRGISTEARRAVRFFISHRIYWSVTSGNSVSIWSISAPSIFWICKTDIPRSRKVASRRFFEYRYAWSFLRHDDGRIIQIIPLNSFRRCHTFFHKNRIYRVNSEYFWFKFFTKFYSHFKL